MTTPPNIDISPEEWDIVSHILQTHIPNKEVWAFGSRVTGKAKLYSDLDLVILGETPLSLDLLATLAHEFTESDLPFKVDLVDWATTSVNFRKIIEKQRIVLRQA